MLIVLHNMVLYHQATLTFGAITIPRLISEDPMVSNWNFQYFSEFGEKIFVHIYKSGIRLMLKYLRKWTSRQRSQKVSKSLQSEAHYQRSLTKLPQKSSLSTIASRSVPIVFGVGLDFYVHYWAHHILVSKWAIKLVLKENWSYD